MPTAAPTAYPFVQNRTVYYLTDSATADNIWSTTQKKNDSVEELIDMSPTTFISVMSGITPIPANIPGPYQSALMQQTANNDASSSNLDIHWDNGLFNGMLFKDFALNGCHFELVRYTLYTPVNKRTIAASHVNIEVTSPSTGLTSNFVWEPYENQVTQGPMKYQEWVTNTFNETTGTNGSWPWAPTTVNGTEFF